MSMAYSTTLVLVLGRELLSELCISALGETAAEPVASSPEDTPSESLMDRTPVELGSLFRADELREEFAQGGCKISRSMAAICFP